MSRTGVMDVADRCVCRGRPARPDSVAGVFGSVTAVVVVVGRDVPREHGRATGQQASWRWKTELRGRDLKDTNRLSQAGDVCYPQAVRGGSLVRLTSTPGPWCEYRGRRYLRQEKAVAPWRRGAGCQ